MDIFISIVTWFFIGGIIDFFLSLSVINLVHYHRAAAILLGTFTSAFRIQTVFYLLNKTTSDSMFLCLLIADILWGVATTCWHVKRFGLDKWTTELRAGRCIGSALFLIYFCAKNYL